MTCETAYSFIETMVIIGVSLIINGLIAAIIVQYILRLISENFKDVPLFPPLPLREERPAPAGFTPVDTSAWEHEPSGGVADE